MATPANPSALQAQDLPGAGGDRGLTVADVLRLRPLAGAGVVAGASGLQRRVGRLGLLDGAGTGGVRPGGLVLATAATLAAAPPLDRLVAALDERGAAGLLLAPGVVLPAATRLAADRLGLPVVALADGVAVDDVLEAVLVAVLPAVLHPEAAALGRSEEMHRALLQVVLEGGGLPELAAGLVGLLGGAVVVTTPDGRVLADAGDVRALGQFYAGACFEASGRMRTEHEPPGLGGHPGLAGNHVVVPITAGRVDHGRIVAFSPTGALTAADVPTVERAGTVAALAVAKQLAVRAVESKYQGDFLRDLLSGLVGTEVGVAHAASLGWDVDRPVVVVVAELDPVEGDDESGAPVARPAGERFAAAWQSVVRPRDPRAPVVGFHREVVAVLGVPPSRDADRLVREIVREVSGDGGGGRRSFGTGVSRVAARPEGIPRAYGQARTAVRVGRRVQGAGSVAHFDTLGAYRLLSLVPDDGELRAFADETLGPLARPGGSPQERQEGADLRHTLEVLLDANLNVAQAARELHFHYNTLRYRIAKLERLLGPFAADPQLRLSLHLALHILRMHEP